MRIEKPLPKWSVTARTPETCRLVDNHDIEFDIPIEVGDVDKNRIFRMYICRRSRTAVEGQRTSEIAATGPHQDGNTVLGNVRCGDVYFSVAVEIARGEPVRISPGG